MDSEGGTIYKGVGGGKPKMRKGFVSLLILLVFGYAIAARGDGSESVMIPLVNNRYLTEWLILGPFSGKDLERDFLADVGGEANICPKEGDAVITPDGKRLIWRRYVSQEDFVDLIDAMGDYESVTAYTFCEIVSPKTQKLEMLVGSNNGVKVWLNGDMVYLYSQSGRFTLARDSVVISLLEGTNRLLVKVSQDKGGKLAVRFRDRVHYLQSARLTISLRREDKNRRVLEIIPQRLVSVLSQVWSLTPLPVRISIFLIGQAQPLDMFEIQEGHLSLWPIPSDVRGNLKVVAELTDEIGERHTAVNFIRTHPVPMKKSPRGHWKYFTPADGLADMKVYKLFQDSQGTLWLGCHNGLSKYDGQQFENYTFHDSGMIYVRDFLEDDEGNIWICADGRLKKYDGHTFQPITTKDGLSDRISAMTIAPNGDIWFVTSSGICRYDGTAFHNLDTELISGRDIHTIFVDRHGNLWLGTDQGIIKYDERGFYRWEQGELAYLDVRDILEDNDGNLWFATDKGVSRYDGQVFENFRREDGLVSDNVQSILQDREGNIWFAMDKGVILFDGKSFRAFTMGNGLPDNNVRDIFEDREGLIWFATDKGGVSYYDRSFRVFSEEDGLISNRTWNMFIDSRGNLWIGAYGGVSKYDGKSFQNFTHEDGLANIDIRAIGEDKNGNLWFGGGETFGPPLRGGRGVTRFDGQHFQTFTVEDGLAGNTVYSIYKDSRGNLWFTTCEGGVSKYDGKVFYNLTRKKGLVNNQVRSMVEDMSGNFWFGTVWGITRYNGNSFYNWTPGRDGISKYIFPSMVDRNGNIWFGTVDFGLMVYDGKGFQRIDIRNGLACNNVYGLLEDSHGYLWFGTEGGGVSKYDGKSFQNFTTEDGLPDNRVRSIVEDDEGALWFATEGGIARYKPLPYAKPPLIFITQVIADKVYPSPQKLKLPASVKRLTIEYKGLTFRTRFSNILYAYRLEGKDEDWCIPTRERRVDYTDLKPGFYTFYVKAINRDLQYSEQPTAVSITILPPPVYARTGFIVGLILTAFLILTAIYAIMILRQKRAQPFEPIPNPYIVGNPIRSKEMFFGREDDFRFIRDKLVGSPTGLIVVLVGERRSGKTSILYQILNGRLGERFVSVLIDMQAMAVRNEEEFFERIAVAVEEKMQDAGFKIQDARYKMQEVSNPVHAFEGFIAEVLEALDGKTLLFLFDEYELLETKVEEGVLRPDSLTFFAGLLERHPRIAFIFTGSRHLEERRAEYWKVLLPKSIARHISFLSERDTYRLIREPVKGTVKFAKGVPEAIYRLTAGQPFYTQVICQNLIDLLNAEERYVVGLNDVRAVVREIEENPLPQMIYFWESLPPEQRLALSALAELQEKPDQSVSVEDILRFVGEYELPINFSEAEWRGALEGLCRREVVERVSDKGEYRFRIDLFRPWVKHGHSVWEAGDIDSVRR
jgi:ligand-binding sensor domain-containing protein